LSPGLTVLRFLYVLWGDKHLGIAGAFSPAPGCVPAHVVQRSLSGLGGPAARSNTPSPAGSRPIGVLHSATLLVCNSATLSANGRSGAGGAGGGLPDVQQAAALTRRLIGHRERNRGAPACRGGAPDLPREGSVCPCEHLGAGPGQVGCCPQETKASWVVSYRTRIRPGSRPSTRHRGRVPTTRSPTSRVSYLQSLYLTDFVSSVMVGPRRRSQRWSGGEEGA
jgi:hypothetical protein